MGLQYNKRIEPLRGSDQWHEAVEQEATGRN